MPAATHNATAQAQQPKPANPEVKQCLAPMQPVGTPPRHTARTGSLEPRALAPPPGTAGRTTGSSTPATTSRPATGSSLRPCAPYPAKPTPARPGRAIFEHFNRRPRTRHARLYRGRTHRHQGEQQQYLLARRQPRDKRIAPARARPAEELGGRRGRAPGVHHRGRAEPLHHRLPLP